MLKKLKNAWLNKLLQETDIWICKNSSCQKFETPTLQEARIREASQSHMKLLAETQDRDT